MHYTKFDAGPHPYPVIVSGKDRWVVDENGNRYFDGLSSLFCVNSGHGREELANAAADQARRLDFFTNWSAGHPPAFQLAERLADLAPGDLNTVFFCSGGSEAVDSAIKLARQYHRVCGRALKSKVISRHTAYHGATFGALTATGITDLRVPFEPLLPGGCHVPATNIYRLAPDQDASVFAEVIEERILFEGPETVAAVILEPVQNAGGCFTPPDGYFQRVREICDTHEVLLISDEVICAWGRLGEWFGSSRYQYQPDIITTAKGLTNASFPLGAVIARDRIADAFRDSNTAFLHGFTFGGHPIGCAIALAHIDLIEREQLLQRVRQNEWLFRAALESLRDLPIVGDVRGAGYFMAIELVRDQGTKRTFSARERDEVLRAFVSPELFRRGLICRADDRGEPVIQMAPPSTAEPRDFDFFVDVLRPVLEGAWSLLESGFQND